MTNILKCSDRIDIRFLFPPKTVSAHMLRMMRLKGLRSWDKFEAGQGENYCASIDGGQVCEDHGTEAVSIYGSTRNMSVDYAVFRQAAIRTSPVRSFWAIMKNQGSRME